MMDFRDNLEKSQQYINALEEERKKIQVFQRELPLCVELVSQAIEACKQQLCEATTVTTPTTECMNGHSECSEQTTSDGPILEEFIPIRRSNSIDDDDEDEHESDKSLNNNLDNINEKSGKKSDWLRSVQLWNQTPDPTTPKQDEQPKKVAVIEVKRDGNGGAFHPFEKEKNINNGNRNENNKQTNISTCSSAQTPNSSHGANKKEKEGQRKSRRCWSPELHRRFVHALQKLGGSHVATPKQIRELMKVDGLTNDEVKSHLQKYRLHTRRPSSGITNNTIANPQAPQFVVVGGIWVPPQEYAAGDTAAPSGIYAPIATMATPPTMHQTSAHSQQQTHSRSNSPATSSSTHTSSASHTH